MFILAIMIDIAFLPFVWATLMNTVQSEGVTTKNFFRLTGILSLTVFGGVGFWVLHGPARVIERANSFKVRKNYRHSLLRGVMTMPMEWHTDHHSGDTIDKINKGTDALFDFAGNSFEVIYGVSQLIISFGMLVYLFPLSAYIVVPTTILTVWIIARIDRVLIEQYKELSRAENKISESVFDSVSNISTVIILRVEKLVFEAIMAKVEKPFQLFRDNNKLNELKWFLTSLCTRFMTASVLLLYFWKTTRGVRTIEVGTLYLLISYLREAGDTYFRFAGIYGDILKNKARVMNSEELTDEFIDESFANHVLPRTWQRLSVEDLSFSYGKPGDELHLDRISISMRKGERIALVGKTGSGKTTYLKLMRDLYHPQSLKLSVDGFPIPHGFEGISRAIALVPQNPEIFATTILENVTLGAEYSQELIHRYTDVACFTDVVSSLPKGFESSIKEKGVNLSGGQVQRLALSRGLLACHEKDVVLLDEPTSSLDLGTERTVYRNIFREFSGKTIVSSIHRLHLLPMFDTIYVFSKGKIVGSGTLEELLGSCQEFQELWQHQFEE